ncbi:dephospho-CoA kinase [Enterocloster sp.]
MAEKQTFILGLIGGVGAGKSTVLTLLKDHYGFYVIQTDLTARRLLEPGEAAF